LIVDGSRKGGDSLPSHTIITRRSEAGAFQIKMLPRDSEHYMATEVQRRSDVAIPEQQNRKSTVGIAQ
jgi:hypothetical protein